MRVYFTEEDHLFAKKEIARRQNGNREIQTEDPKASVLPGPVVEGFGVYGELTVAMAFHPYLNREMLFGNPGRDKKAIDFVCPSGHTIQVKCPSQPGYNFMMTVKDGIDYMKADFGILVDLQRSKEYADIYGWVTRKRFNDLKEIWPNCKDDNRTVKRGYLVTLGGKIPFWVTEKVEEWSK